MSDLDTITFDPSRVARTGDTTRPVTVVGCWAVKLFGAEVNPGLVNVTALQDRIAELESWPKRKQLVVAGMELSWTMEDKDGYVEQGGIISMDNVATGHTYNYHIPYTQVWSVTLTPLTDGGRASFQEANNVVCGIGNANFTIASCQGKTPCRFMWTAKGMK